MQSVSPLSPSVYPVGIFLLFPVNLFHICRTRNAMPIQLLIFPVATQWEIGHFSGKHLNKTAAESPYSGKIIFSYDPSVSSCRERPMEDCFRKGDDWSIFSGRLLESFFPKRVKSRRFRGQLMKKNFDPTLIIRFSVGYL